VIFDSTPAREQVAAVEPARSAFDSLVAFATSDRPPAAEELQRQAEEAQRRRFREKRARMRAQLVSLGVPVSATTSLSRMRELLSSVGAAGATAATPQKV
jgi:hypothetical protein